MKPPGLACLCLPAFSFLLIAAESPADSKLPPSSSSVAPREREITWNNPESPRLTGMEHHALFSAAMGVEMGFNVWQPAAYPRSDRRWPVIYFLHGAGGNENADAPAIAGLVQRAIEEKKVPPALCVFPNGGMSGYRDQPERKIMMETFLFQELIPHIDQHWRTLATREGRVLAGFSMGGGGAIRLAVKRPDLFGAAASWAAAFGNRRPELAEEASRQLKQNAAEIKKDKLGLLLIVGEKDFTREGHEPFIAQLKDLGIAYEYQVLPGVGHDLGKYESETGARLIEFLGRHFERPGL